jgi:hypothetical protein
MFVQTLQLSLASLIQTLPWGTLRLHLQMCRPHNAVVALGLQFNPQVIIIIIIVTVEASLLGPLLVRRLLRISLFKSKLC